MNFQPSLDPIVLRHVFVTAVRDLFSTAHNYGDLQDKLGNWHWDADDKKANLRIDLDHNFSAKGLKEFPVPTVWVGVENFDFAKIAIDNFSSVTPDMSRTVYTHACTTGVSIRCVSKKGDEALGLATVAALYFAGLRPLFMRRLGLNGMELKGISKPEGIKDAPDEYVMSICAITLNFNFSLETSIESHRIKMFTTTLTP